MGFVMGTGCSSHSTPRHFQSPCYRPSPFSGTTRRISFTSRRQRNIRVVKAVQNREYSLLHSGSCARRVILFLGFALIPLLGIGNKAIQGLTAENIELKEGEQKQKEKGNSSQIPILSLFNALGVLGSGILAALYVSTKKLKSKSDVILESMELELEEKNAAIASLEKKMELELAKEKEFCKHAIEKANEEHHSLANRLVLANNTITGMGKELQKQKKLVEELIPHVNDLEVSLHAAAADRKELEELLMNKLESESLLQEQISLLSSEIRGKDDDLRLMNSKLVEKDRAFGKLSLAYEELKNQLTTLKLEMKELKDAIVKKEKEMEWKCEMVEKLEQDLTFSVAEKDEVHVKLNYVLVEYEHFKSVTEERSALDAKQLVEQEEKINKLEEQHRFNLEEVKNKELLASDLNQEKEILKGKLNAETERAKLVEQELNITREALVKSRDEASDLAKQLHQSRSICSELEADAFKVKAEYIESQESLQRDLNRLKKQANALNAELLSANEILSKSHAELQSLYQELAAAIEERDSLKLELTEACRKAETAALDLENERKIISSLRNELMAVKDEGFKDKEARKSLEANLKETTETLDEMNRSSMKLAKEVELAASEISSLAYEKDALYQALDEQKRCSMGVRQDLEDAENMVAMLGTVKEKLESKAMKLEEELACAKGEILRLRRNETDPAKKGVRRRRKGNRQQQT